MQVILHVPCKSIPCRRKIGKVKFNLSNKKYYSFENKHISIVLLQNYRPRNSPHDYLFPLSTKSMKITFILILILLLSNNFDIMKGST